MPIAIEAEMPPLSADTDGTIRVGGTRLLLDLVIRAYRTGETAETIAAAYPPVSAADVHGAIAYYLRHQAALDSYLGEREREGERTLQTIRASGVRPRNCEIGWPNGKQKPSNRDR